MSEEFSPDMANQWATAAKRGRFSDADPCNQFYRCSYVTRLLSEAIWNQWHFFKHAAKTGLRADTISVSGETLLHAVVAVGREDFAMHEGEHRLTRNDLAQLRRAVQELREADFVLEIEPGVWHLRFGTPFGPERVEIDSDRKWLRKRYSEAARR